MQKTRFFLPEPCLGSIVALSEYEYGIGLTEPVRLKQGPYVPEAYVPGHIALGGAIPGRFPKYQDQPVA